MHDGAEATKVATTGGVVSPGDNPQHAHIRDNELAVITADWKGVCADLAFAPGPRPPGRGDRLRRTDAGMAPVRQVADIHRFVDGQELAAVAEATRLDPTDLPGYAGRVHDYFAAHPERYRLMMWGQLELDLTQASADGPVRQSMEYKTEQLRSAQEAGDLDPSWVPFDVLVLVNQIAMSWAGATGPGRRHRLAGPRGFPGPAQGSDRRGGPTLLPRGGRPLTSAVRSTSRPRAARSPRRLSTRTGRASLERSTRASRWRWAPVPRCTAIPLRTTLPSC
ncbi:hypothetical protein ABZ234_15170 [Nocardiopsis sp. NPDC006198]|uniref:hypothetical protein n=1 Tax=Nocardiopsis sp. NPDC006198 TaxID=3154472 RepID=UPI0033B4E098